MKQYLKQIFNVLRPGGIFMFSYNNGDTPQGAGMAENFAQSYMPKSMLTVLCESLGYEIADSSSYNTNIHWLEVRKPGELETIKAHQVLGEIKRVEN
jgi:SAM-dependent methyltransferase